MISALNRHAPDAAHRFFSELCGQTAGFITDFEIDEPRHEAEGGSWTWSLDMRVGAGLLADCIGLPEDLMRHCRLLENRMFLMAVDRMRRSAGLPPLHSIDEARIWMGSHDYLKGELDELRTELRQLVPMRLHAEGGGDGAVLRLLLIHPHEGERVVADGGIPSADDGSMPAALDGIFERLLDAA